MTQHPVLTPPPSFDKERLKFTDSLGRTRYRRFDWEECKRLSIKGWSREALAKRYKVSLAGIDRVLYPSVRKRSNENAREWIRKNQPPCRVCGKESTKNGICRSCVNEQRVRRNDAPHGPWLWCPGCEAWKHQERDFAPDKARPKRGKRNYCRRCDTLRKREYRARKKLTEEAKERRFAPHMTCSPEKEVYEATDAHRDAAADHRSTGGGRTDTSGETTDSED